MLTVLRLSSHPLTVSSFSAEWSVDIASCFGDPHLLLGIGEYITQSYFLVTAINNLIQPLPLQIGKTTFPGVQTLAKVFLGPSFSLPKVYCNAVLSYLNARKIMVPASSATVDLNTNGAVESRVCHDIQQSVRLKPP